MVNQCVVGSNPIKVMSKRQLLLMQKMDNPKGWGSTPLIKIRASETGSYMLQLIISYILWV